MKFIYPNYLIFCEHPHVVTLGKSAGINNVLANKRSLNAKGVEFIQSNRGGDVTYHGPGQIVGYPIFDLDLFFTDIHRYMRSLEEVIIKTIAEFGVTGKRIPGQTGVWIDINSNPRKICAFGVRSSRWVTMHGFALNVNTDLSFYDLIIPCGISDKTVTSLEAEVKTPIDINQVKEKIKFHFTRVFKIQYID